MKLSEKCILVIDDDSEILILLEKVVGGTGAKCLTANTVAEGVKIATEVVPHLIIVDLFIPEVDGFAFLEMRQKSETIKHIPVLVFSAANRKSKIKHALNLGATDYLLKPLESAYLIQKIRKCLLPFERTPVVSFGANPQKVTVSIPGEITGISENKIKVQGRIKLNKGRSAKIDSALMNEFNIKNFVMTVVQSSVNSDEIGQYVNYIKFIGLKENDSNTIKTRVRNWK